MSKASLSKVPKNGGWGISTDGKDPKLCTNFYADVTEKVYIYRVPESKPTTHVTLQARFSDGESEAFTVALSDLDKVNWADIDDRCILYPDVAPATAQRYIVNHIREKLPDAETKTQYRICKVGNYTVGDESGYCIGGEVLRPPQADRSIVIEPEGICGTLDYDPDLAEEEAIVDMFELMSLFPNLGRVLLAYNLLFLMWQLYAFAWKAPRFCLYIEGVTGAGKTTVSQFFCQLYNRRKGIEPPPRFDSSPAWLVQNLSELSHCVRVFDDLCPTDAKDVQREQEKTVIKVIRIIGDAVWPHRVNDTKREPPAVGVVLIGEYLIKGTESDMARFLPIEVSPLDDETIQRLTVFQQENPLVTSTFYRNFIRWTVDNHDWAKAFLKEWWAAYGRSDFTAFGTKVHPRLRETHYYMNTAYAMFLEYCTEKGCILEEDARALHESFLKLLTELVLAQQVRVDEGKTNTKPDARIDYLAFIRELYKSGRFRLAPSAKEFNTEAHDGVVHLGRLYIYGESFRRIIGAANANLTAVLDDLESRGALVLGNELEKDRTVQLFINPKEKRRCYAIFLTHLK